jgi:hypothetical protein
MPETIIRENCTFQIPESNTVEQLQMLEQKMLLVKNQCERIVQIFFYDDDSVTLLNDCEYNSVPFIKNDKYDTYYIIKEEYGIYIERWQFNESKFNCNGIYLLKEKKWLLGAYRGPECEWVRLNEYDGLPYMIAGIGDTANQIYDFKRCCIPFFLHREGNLKGYPIIYCDDLKSWIIEKDGRLIAMYDISRGHCFGRRREADHLEIAEIGELKKTYVLSKKGEKVFSIQDFETGKMMENLYRDVEILDGVIITRDLDGCMSSYFDEYAGRWRYGAPPKKYRA